MQDMKYNKEGIFCRKLHRTIPGSTEIMGVKGALVRHAWMGIKGDLSWL